VRPARTFRRAFVLVALPALLVLGVALPAGAHPLALSIDDTALLTPEGHLELRGQMACTLGERFRLTVTVQQDGASARGLTTGVCTGARQTWQVLARTTQGTFQPGPAQACATLTTFTQAGQQHGASRTSCEPVQIV
jgi:hypothetical protein